MLDPGSRGVCSIEFNRNNPREHDHAQSGRLSRRVRTLHLRIPRRNQSKTVGKNGHTNKTNLKSKGWKVKLLKGNRRRFDESGGREMEKEGKKRLGLGRIEKI